MRYFYLLATLLLAGQANFAQTNFNHPVSGFQEVILGPGTYNYYDNGGPNGNYSANINSFIGFIPSAGNFISSVNLIAMDIEYGGPDCPFDKLTYGWINNCDDIYWNYDLCGQPAPGTLVNTLCAGESISFTFESDGTVQFSGWHIQIVVKAKTPINKICNPTDQCLFEEGILLDCGGGSPTITGDYSIESTTSFLEEFYCWAFGLCYGQIDTYPGCSNQSYPGRERVYPLIVDEASTIVIECDCITDIFLLSTACNCLTNVQKIAGQFIIPNLPAGSYWLAAEYDCGGDICSCDFQFNCIDSGPGVLDCSNATPIWCNSSDFSSNAAASGGVANVNSYCNPPLGNSWTGRERVYSFYSDINGIVQISLTGMSANLDLIVLKSCDRTDCVASSTKGGAQSESISLNVKKGETYFIIIDGVNYAQSNYSLELQCEEKEDCIECGQCFTYSLVNKGSVTDVACRSKYNDCSFPNFPSSNHSFRWTIDGVQSSTNQNPIFTISTHKPVTVCQEIRFNNTIVYSCCWVINPAPGCQQPPVAHWSSTFDPLDLFKVQYNASMSKGAGDYYWDYGDGTSIVSSANNPISNKTYSASQPQTKKTCVYVQNQWGLSQYCKSQAPAAFECAASPSPKFDYTLNGNTISITSDNPSNIIKDWEIDFGNGVKTNGTNWTTQTLTYANSGTFEVCIRFRVEFGQSLGIPCSFDGCIYFTVRVGCCVFVQDNCSNLKYKFLDDNNGLLYELSRSTDLNQQAIGWEVDDVPVPNSNQNVLQYNFPGAGLYKICFIYLNPANGCFIKCCRLVWIGNPFECGNILFLYEAGKGYQFYTEANGNDFTWTNDETGEEIGQGKITNFISIPGPSGCKEVNISVRYFDPLCNCWRICCLRIYLCDPTVCQGEIKVITQPGPGSTALCVDNSLTQVRWICLDNNQQIGTGNCINITNMTCKAYCVQYYDPVSKCYRMCCLDWTSSLKEPEALTRIVIRPNPFRDELDVLVEFSNPLETRLELLDMHGRLVGVLTRGPDLIHQFQVDTQLLSSGIYSLRILTSDGEIIRRVMKQ